MLTDAWGVIAQWYDTAPYPDSILEAPTGLTVVTGVYRGTARSTGRAYEAEFAHLWRCSEGLASSLHQYTDTAQWIQAIAETGT